MGGKAGNWIVEDVQVAEPLSDLAEKAKGSRSAGGTDAGYHFFSNKKNDCYGEMSKQIKIWKPITSEIGMAIKSDKILRLEFSSDSRRLTKPQFTGVGQRIHAKSSCWLQNQ